MNNIESHKKFKKIITMCSLEKINFVYNYTLNNFKNLGDIFEIGTFAGSITQSLALGSEKFNPKIYTVDKFIWDKDKKKKFPKLKFEDKDDFSSYVIETLSEYENVKIYKSDFVEIRPNKEIELMFVDAPKRMKYVIQFAKIFANFWMENKTKLLFEDYNQFMSYELPATLLPISKNFKFYTDKSDIVVADVIKNKIDIIDYEYMDIRRWDVKQIKENWDQICSIGDNNTHLDKNISILMHLIDNNFVEEAKKFLEDKQINLKKYEHKNKFILRYSNILNE